MRTRSRPNSYNGYYASETLGFGYASTSTTHDGVKYYAPFHSLVGHLMGHATARYASTAPYAHEETMIDKGGPMAYDQYGKLCWNEVNHQRTTYENAMGGEVLYNRWKGQQARAFCSLPPTLTASQVPPSLSAYDHAVLYAECYAELVPALQDDLSLANFILELREFKGIMKHFTNGRDAISSLATDIKRSVRVTPPKRGRYTSQADWERQLKSYKKQRLLNVADVASKADLSYHYALKPFVRDTAMMSVLYGQMREKIAKFNRQGSVRNVRHAQRDFGAGTSSLGSSNTYIDRTYSAGKYRLTAEMTYRLRERSELSQFIRYMGLDLQPSTVWNAIPFTFVIDHFTNIGEAMAGLDVSDVDMNMTRLMESIKSEYGVVHCVRPGAYSRTYGTGGLNNGASTLCGWVDGEIPSSSSVRSSYQRSLVGSQYVKPPILPRLQIPTLDQMRLDLDLVYQLFGRGNNTPTYRTG